MSILVPLGSKTILFSNHLPSWVAPPEMQPGSIDPLGYQTEVDNISNQILPGVTVFTTRIRYLSFLCWAHRETGGNDSLIDRWEVALSAGEFFRHKSDAEKTCSFLGSLLLKQASPDPRDRLPVRLHTPPARIRYKSLLRSCGLIDDRGELREAGEDLAEIFGRNMPKNIPKTIGGCRNMPCLSGVGRLESRWLRGAFLRDGSPGAERRLATFKEIGKPLLREVLKTGSVRPVLETYLDSKKERESDTARMLHRAAIIELEAFPLTSLFHFLYENGALQRTILPKQKSLRSPYILKNPKSDLDGFLQDMVNHLSKAERLRNLGDVDHNIHKSMKLG
jgi:hypothetical protein